MTLWPPISAHSPFKPTLCHVAIYFRVSELIQAAPYVNALMAEWDLRQLDLFHFEKLVAQLFDAEGFVVQCYGSDPADSLDLTATKGGVTFGVQCRHWKSPRVGIKEVRAFSVALLEHGLNHGFLIAFEGFTHAGATFARRNHIELMDEPTLRRNLEEVHWRLNPAFIELMDDERKACPQCQSDLTLRTIRKGPQAGQRFWACSTAPRCDFKAPA